MKRCRRNCSCSTLIVVLLFLQLYLMMQNIRFMEKVDESKKKVICPNNNAEKVPASKLASFKCNPQNHRLFPLCVPKFEIVQALWQGRCFQDVHGVNGSSCSVMQYLSNVEPYCPPMSTHAALPKQTKKTKLRLDLEGVLSLLSLKNFDWLRQRASQMWPDWKEAAQKFELSGKLKQMNQKKILMFLGSMSFQPTILTQAGKGGFLGELVQWTDLMVSAYMLGHDVTVIADVKTLAKVLTADNDFCASKTIEASRDFDIIFTDFNGIVFMQQLGSSNFARLRCKLRTLDSFGTEAEFNYYAYPESIPGGKSSWALKDLLLPQILTYFPHSPDNTFLGFVGGNGKLKQLPKKKDQAVIYGKNEEYLQGRIPFLDVVKKYFEIHSTMKDSKNFIPEYVVNHDVLDGKSLKRLLAESKLFIGLGFPYEGPGPIEAIANGAVFLNPQFKPAKNKFNTDFFKDKPTLRKLTSQNPYLEDFVGEPYVYTIDIDNTSAVEDLMKSLKSRESFEPHLPRELTNLGMLERIYALTQYQNFCDLHAPRWPPLSSLHMALSPAGVSCKHECHQRGLICESSFFTDINNVTNFERFGVACNKTVKSRKLYHPSYDLSTGQCIIQDDFMYFSCVAAQSTVRRLCPCRDYQKEQTALCKNCL